MSRKSQRASRTRKQSKRQRSQRQRSQRQRQQGGSSALMGAPLSDSLAGGWSSKMAMGHGGDYLKYHMGQHGGSLAGAPVNVIGHEGLPASMQGAAMTAGTMKAYADIAGLKDQAGGRRRKNKKSKKQRKSRSKRSNRSKRQRRSQRQRRTRNKQRGGSKLDFAPVSSASMLLSDYSKTGMSPQWNSGVEFDGAAARQAM